ncbi:MAG: hypothetical protein AB7T37_12240 [Dehalococcoidia bacterium]
MRFAASGRTLLVIAAAVGAVLVGVAAEDSSSAAGARPQLGASTTIIVPSVGADAVPDFQSIMPPQQAGTECYQLGVVETQFIDGATQSGWRDRKPSLERNGGESGAGEGFWADRVLAKDGLVPVRGHYVVRRFGSVQEGPPVLPRALPDGSFEFAGWVETPVTESDNVYVELCIEWGAAPQTATDTNGQLKTGAAKQGGLVEVDESAPGAAFVDPNYKAARRLGSAGLVEPGVTLPLGGESVEGPFRTVVVLNGASPIPALPTVTTTGIFEDYVPGTTGVSFDFIDPFGSFSPVFQCTTPLGPGAVTLPYPVWPGTHQPFVLNFPTASLAAAVALGDFHCEPTGSTPLGSAPDQAGVIVVPESWTTVVTPSGPRKGEVISAVASVRLYNSSLVDIILDGWSLSQFLEDSGIPVAYRARSLDGVRIPGGGSIVVEFDDALTIYAPLILTGPSDPDAPARIFLPNLETVFNIFRRP